jgi:tetratricopeptide (TPR) repeat protein
MAENDIPTITLKNGDEVSIAEYERILGFLKATCADRKVLSENLFGLSDLSGERGLLGICALYTKGALECAEEPEMKARCYLRLGQLKESEEEYGDAMLLYAEAFSLEPGTDNTWYFLHNNLGYCLNRFRMYSEAEYYCRTAIGINPGRFNAYKNLGWALEGQGKYVEAAWMLIHAAQLCPEDPRALHILKDLLETHREEIRKDPAILVRLDALEKFARADRPGSVH